jgi:hypothetical protein
MVKPRIYSDYDMMNWAFWHAHTDEDKLPMDELIAMSEELEALAQDAVSYWIMYGKAPLLAEKEEVE